MALKECKKNAHANEPTSMAVALAGHNIVDCVGARMPPRVAVAVGVFCWLVGV
jgi:hypothetical protein